MYHFKNSSRHINRYLKNGVSSSIVHEIKHVDFQLYRAHPERVIWNKLTADDEHINKGIRTFIHQTMSLSGVEKEKFLERNFNSVWKKTGFFNINIRDSENVYLFVSLSPLVSFGDCIYLYTEFFWCREKWTLNNKYLLELIKSSRREHVMRTCFKFWPMKNIFGKLSANETLNMACLQIHWEQLSLATFLRAHSNSKEISYLPWQNKYPNLKTTSHIKPKFFL